MNSEVTKKNTKIPLALGMFWLGVALATAILAYGTSAGARHPNPSMVLIPLAPMMLAGLAPAWNVTAQKKGLIVLQAICFLVFVVVLLVMDSKSVGPNWPAYTTVLTAVVLAAASFGIASLMGLGVKEVGATEADQSPTE